MVPPNQQLALPPPPRVSPTADSLPPAVIFSASINIVAQRVERPGDGAGEEGVVGGGVPGGGGGIRCPAPISRLRVEKIEGGLMVAGVVVAANCQLALPAFGFLFVLVGCVLTAASYRGPAEDEEPEHYAARIAFTGNSRVLGPACIVVGLLMLAAGVGLCLLTRRARRRERRVGFHCPLHGDFYPLSPVSGVRSFVNQAPDIFVTEIRLLSPTLPGSDETVKVPTSTILPSENVSTAQPEITVVAPASPPTTLVSPTFSTENKTSVSSARGPRKSVSIVLPEEDKG
ncbi:Uncharacterized protein GBIM_04375 [Gryllus bimaculatus]|nr:Uncharacterized protein GBIM_04375 [Gryllus bimaculatus]